MTPAARAALAIACLAVPARAWEWNQLDLEKAASGGKKLFRAASGMSEAQEIRLGREVAANLVARYGLSDDAAGLKYVNLVGHAVARNSARPKLPYRFGILQTDEYNAFAAPGGYIFVTRGLLRFVQDEAELAGILAHEICHVTERHIVKAIGEANWLGAGKDLASAAGQDLEAYGALGDFSINLLEKGLSRKDELEADRQGTRLTAKAGYDARGLRDAVERLAGRKPKEPALAKFNSTHPPAAERLKAIDAVRSLDPGPRLPERYARHF